MVTQGDKEACERDRKREEERGRGQHATKGKGKQGPARPLSGPVRVVA